MRVLVLAKEDHQSRAATPPTPEAVAEFQKFNDELIKAGVVIGDGRLYPSSQGKRLRFDGRKRTVIDGPFAETKEPGAWLMGTARHRAIDGIRRRQTLERKHEEIGRDFQRAREGIDVEAVIDEDVGDDVLGLIFMACHPVLSK